MGKAKAAATGPQLSRQLGPNPQGSWAGVQWTDVLALAGDSSDNVPGVKGIGLKGALALIHQFGSLEAVLQRAPEVLYLTCTSRVSISHACAHVCIYVLQCLAAWWLSCSTLPRYNPMHYTYIMCLQVV